MSRENSLLAPKTKNFWPLSCSILSRVFSRTSFPGVPSGRPNSWQSEALLASLTSRGSSPFWVCRVYSSVCVCVCGGVFHICQEMGNLHVWRCKGARCSVFCRVYVCVWCFACVFSCVYRVVCVYIYACNEFCTLVSIMTVFFFLDKKNSSSNSRAKAHRFGLCSQRSVSIQFFFMLKKRQSLWKSEYVCFACIGCVYIWVCMCSYAWMYVYMHPWDEYAGR
jgi:hypothetical protein